jgi:hypothetical protein
LRALQHSDFGFRSSFGVRSSEFGVRGGIKIRIKKKNAGAHNILRAPLGQRLRRYFDCPIVVQSTLAVILARASWTVQARCCSRADRQRVKQITSQNRQEMDGLLASIGKTDLERIRPNDLKTSDVMNGYFMPCPPLNQIYHLKPVP